MIQVKQRQNYWLLAGLIIGIELLGMLSSILSGDVRGIYESLTLPPLSPPGQLFGIVWPTLYLLVAISGYLISMAVQPKSVKRPQLIWYGLQLVVNFGWSIIFFGAQMYWLGFLMTIVMDLLVIGCLIRFYPTSRAAAWLLVPYLAWLLFATYLAGGAALLN